MNSPRTYVGGIQDDVPRQFALDAKIPDKGLWVDQVRIDRRLSGQRVWSGSDRRQSIRSVRKAATAGSVFTTSPNDPGLMTR